MSTISSSSMSMNSSDYDSDYSMDGSEPSSENVKKGGKTLARSKKTGQSGSAYQEEEVEKIVMVDSYAEAKELIQRRGETDDMYTYRQDVYERIRRLGGYGREETLMYTMMIINYATASCIPAKSDLRTIEKIALECDIEI